MNQYSLYIGNKNYSSWSMRPWVLLKQMELEFTENKLRFDAFTPTSPFIRAITPINSAGTVPVLIDHTQDDLAIADSLAIVEYLAEQHPERNLWPKDQVMRAQARSLCAQMHSGFKGMRT